MSDYQHRKLMTDKEKEFYVNLINLCPDGFFIFPKIKLAELIKPTADFGSDKFISDFKELNKITIDFAIFDFINDHTVALIYFQENGSFSEEKISVLKKTCDELDVVFHQISKISELYLLDLFKV